ncbi:40S ribosomal protein S17 [Tieghemostelium lacteum]|uniref:40S ribosomal protein S17 n=1 Tax=Tieghemostelium lacteum TaxID=361077 RepID=A0A151Z633_TIELA|nr:40S ribosomal protein S17 [Tieghemostelium lacteum]|eukprot:KYQ89397.1 40S ribosomal protein S17 [Tieghemostelium lacteum]
MGRVRTKTIKRASKILIEKYYPRLTTDFDVNKRTCDKVAKISSKRLRNKIAGFVTHLMKRIEKGPVRGISYKLQEEEREKRDNFVPIHSAIKTEDIKIDNDVLEMLKNTLDFPTIPQLILPSGDGKRKSKKQNK